MRGRFCISRRITLLTISLALIAGGIFLLRTLLLTSPTLNSKAAPSKNNPSIVGGIDVKDPNKWPFMVFFLTQSKKSNYKFFSCAGTLIAPNWILTAGHCVVDTPAAKSEIKHANGDLLHLFPGSNDLVSTDKILENIDRGGIKGYKVYLHDDYYFDEQKRYALNDIALIELDVPLQNIPLVSIQIDKKFEEEGTLSVILGWGITLYEDFPLLLQQAVIPILANSTVENTRYPLNEKEIAAGFIGGGVSACHGDSGGPLLVWDGKKWVQIGIDAWIDDGICGQSNPTVFTRISAHTGWINNIISQSLHNQPLTTFTPFSKTKLSLYDVNEFCQKSTWKEKLPTICNVLRPGR